jgi:hypothetical protein
MSWDQFLVILMLHLILRSVFLQARHIITLWSNWNPFRIPRLQYFKMCGLQKKISHMFTWKENLTDVVPKYTNCVRQRMTFCAMWGCMYAGTHQTNGEHNTAFNFVNSLCEPMKNMLHTVRADHFFKSKTFLSLVDCKYKCNKDSHVKL